MHLFHRMYHADGTLLATGEHMLIHVSLSTRKASAPRPDIAQKLEDIANMHAKIAAPEGVGRAIGQGK